MAQEPEEEFESEGEAEDESPAGGGRKRLLLLVVAALVLVIVAGAAAYFTGLADPLLALITGKKADVATADVGSPSGDAAVAGKEGGSAGKKAKAGEPGAAANGGAADLVPAIITYELPTMTVNVDAASRQKSFLKLTMTVEVASEADIPKLDNVAPRIVDEFQGYLRGLKVDDLRGAAGAYRLKEEFLARINAAVRPIQVKDALIKEMVVQ